MELVEFLFYSRCDIAKVPKDEISDKYDCGECCRQKSELLNQSSISNTNKIIIFKTQSFFIKLKNNI